MLSGLVKVMLFVSAALGLYSAYTLYNLGSLQVADPVKAQAIEAIVHQAGTLGVVAALLAVAAAIITFFEK